MQMGTVKKKGVDFDGQILGCFQMIKSLFVNTADDTTPSDHIPSNKVRVHGFIGSGGQANVYRGVFGNIEVAIKMFKSKDETDAEKLAKLLKLKRHKNLIHLYGVCYELNYESSCSGPALVMELCKTSLYAVIHDKNINISSTDVLHYAKEISSGMRHLHKRGIIHRDLKSANILIGYDNILKISDLDSYTFGTMENTIVSVKGTVGWMAPELIRQEKCSQKVDVWSYGIILWELLTRQVPYDKCNQAHVMWEVGNNRLSTPIPSQIPSQIGAILSSCTDFDPTRRPTFEQISKMIPLAELDMKNISLGTLNQYRNEWQREVNFVLEQYRQRRNESIIKQSDQGLLEINQLKQKLERQYQILTNGNDKSPEYVYNMMSQLPSSVRNSVIRKSLNADAISQLNYRSTSPNMSRQSSKRVRRSRRKSGLAMSNSSYSNEENDEMSDRRTQTPTTVSRNLNYMAKRMNSSSSNSSCDDRSSNQPQSSSDEYPDYGFDEISSEDELDEKMQSPPYTSCYMKRSSITRSTMTSNDEGFDSRGTTIRIPATKRSDTVHRIQLSEISNL